MQQKSQVHHGKCIKKGNSIAFFIALRNEIETLQIKPEEWHSIAVILLYMVTIIYVPNVPFQFEHHFLICYFLYIEVDADPLIQLTEDYKWIPFLDFYWRLGIDGLSIGPILLTGFITILASTRIERRAAC